MSLMSPCYYVGACGDMYTDIYMCMYVQDYTFLSKYAEECALKKRHDAGQRYIIYMGYRTCTGVQLIAAGRKFRVIFNTFGQNNITSLMTKLNC